MREKHDNPRFETLHITTQPQSLSSIHPRHPAKTNKVSPPSRINNAFRSRHAKESERRTIRKPDVSVIPVCEWIVDADGWVETGVKQATWFLVLAVL